MPVRVFALIPALVALLAVPAQGQSRPPAFAQCASCHSAEPGKTVFGPSLHGVGGRKAGSLPGYDYSPALKKTKITWNAATLDRWLTSPQKTVPGTKMPFGGIQDPAARRALITYLLALK